MKEENKLEDIEDDFSYKDILFLERPNPKNHPRQSYAFRAGQFAPFAALSGYDEQINEVSRYVEHKKILSDFEKEQLDIKINLIQQNKKHFIKITYFEKKLRKSGGCYKDKVGYLHDIDCVHHILKFCDKTVIKMKDIVKIDIIESSD